jgi:drug/metabolite transporter (DMT)-like permease
MPPLVIAVLVLGAICASMGAFFLKLGATGRTDFLSFVNGQMLLGIVLYGLGALSWIYALARQNLISVYPFTVLSFVLVYAAGILGLGEAPSRSAGIGVVLILIGLYLVTRNPA